MEESQRDGTHHREKMLGAVGVWPELMIKKMDS